LPAVGELEYIVGWLIEMGEAQQTGNGLIANTWQELEAFSKLFEIRMSWFELNTMRRLSVAYVNEYHRANGNDCQMPCIDIESMKSNVENKVKSLFALLRS